MSNRTDPQNDLAAELDRRHRQLVEAFQIPAMLIGAGPLLGFDAEGTKHDPSNGQFTSGGGSSGTGKKLDTARKAMLQHPAGSPGWKAALAEKRKAEGEHYEASKSEFKETGATKSRQGVEPTRVGETQNGHRIGRKRK